MDSTQPLDYSLVPYKELTHQPCWASHKRCALRTTRKTLVTLRRRILPALLHAPLKLTAKLQKFAFVLRHRPYPVLMRFGRFSGAWHCVFADASRPDQWLPKRLLVYETSELRELAERGKADLDSEQARDEFAEGIRFGRGQIWLRLSAKQRQTLG